MLQHHGHRNFDYFIDFNYCRVLNALAVHSCDVVIRVSRDARAPTYTCSTHHRAT